MGQILSNGGDVDQAGYFRIGNVILNIPPDQIQCHKVINNEEVTPLRMPFAIPVKTGQSRWDVTWSWKCIADPSNDDYSNWQNLQMLVAMFKAAPFVEVENGYIRQIVNPSQLTDGASQDDVMAFALRQMRVDTVPDLSDTLQVTMTMSWFNYRPYSFNFQYADGGGNQVPNALASPLFNTYLQNWININLNNDPTQQPTTGASVSDSDWMSQIPGTITFSCREYQAVGLPVSTVLPAGTPPANTNPGANQPGASVQGSQSGFVDNVFVDTSDTGNPQIQWWVKAVAIPESSNNYNAVNKSTVTYAGAPSAAVGLMQWVRSSAISAMQGSDNFFGTSYISTAQQAGYLVPARTSTGYRWGQKTVSNPQSTDPVLATYISWMQNPPVQGGSSVLQNNMASAWAIQMLRANHGSVLKSWEAHRYGQGIVNQGQTVASMNDSWFTKAVKSWQSNPNQQQAFEPIPSNVTTGSSSSAVSTPVTSGTNNTSNSSPPNLSDSTTDPNNVPMTPAIQFMLKDGWVYESKTEAAAFLYKEHYVKFTDIEHGDNPSSSDLSDVDPNYFVHPTQLSVVFVNNIAQIPLSGYQYPTYQHLGAVSTLVSIGLLSNAAIESGTDSYDEPQHDGLSLLSEMITMLEDQFQRLRNEWRYVSAIHRMQSVAIKSQVLNLLGIRGLLTKELTTETVPESPNLVTAQYNASQYENIYFADGPTPYVMSSPNQYADTWKKIMRDGTMNQFSGNASLKTLTNLSTMMQNPTSANSQQLLFNWLVGKSDSLLGAFVSPPAIPPAALIVPTPSPFQQQEQSLMLQVIDEGSGTSLNADGTITQDWFSFSGQYPDAYNRIISHAQLNYTDYFLIKNGVSPLAPDYQKLQTLVQTIDPRIQAAVAATPNSESPVDQLFDYYLGYAYSNNVLNLASQMAQVQQSPQVQPLFVTPTTVSTPGALNLGHVCYFDMGLTTVQFGGRDYTPAFYFYNDNANLTTLLNNQVSTIVASTTQSAASFAGVTQITKPNNLQSTSTQSFTGNVSGIISSIKPSMYTMAKAFPTFKLFLMEDNSQKKFYAYDNFYSYATVMDMEIIRYRDKPDTAIIQISNLLHLLDQHLYDSTVQGRQAKALRVNTDVALPTGEPLTTSAGGVGGVDAGGFNVWNLDNRFPEISQHNGNGDPKFPLKYFALQTGTKIQIRMGFSNNPDLLTPVFTGEVTQIEGNEILTITCQSYMVELISPVQDEIAGDNGFAIDTTVNKVVNDLVKISRDTLTGRFTNLPSDITGIFGNVPAYSGSGTVGGVKISGIITPGGSAADVISAMLTVSTSKHFGHWQLGAPTDPYIKGYTWQAAIASSLSLLNSSPLTAGATGLETGYDRSFENILTSHIFGPNGTATADPGGGARGWWFEKPGGYGAPEYFVPRDPTLTPWTLIQDIARRYPEFILAVKQYGFPFTADATLVFANPHDFYATRPPIPGEVQQQQQAASDQILFSQWWTQNGTNSGQSQFNNFCTSLGKQWANAVLKNYDKSIGYTGDSAVSILGQAQTILDPLTNFGGDGGTSMENLTAEQLTTHITGGGPGTFFTILSTFSQTVASPVSEFLYGIGGGNSFGHGVSPFQAQQGISQLVQNYYNWIAQKQTGSTSVAVGARMKPVRQWHLVNADNIIHNGIILNEKFYNVCRLGNQSLAANDSIAPQYRRVLVADQFIVSKENLKSDVGISNAYMQSFLRDQLAQAYKGELVLIGNPDIEPFDVIMMLDPSTGISGPIEVDSVIHSFNLENGFITIVKPRAMVVVNDKLSAPLYSAVWQMLTQVQGQIEGFANNLPFFAAPVPGGTVTNSSTLVPATEATLGLVALTAGMAASPWVAGAVALGGLSLVFWLGQVTNRLNPMGMIPLTRFSRPWISGLEGWRIDDLLGTIGTKWQYFKTDEIEPIIDSFRQARGMGLI